MDQMVKKKDEKKDDGDADKDDLRDSLDKSQRLIRREYDVCYDRLGRRFAVGDSECILQPLFQRLSSRVCDTHLMISSHRE